MTTDYNPNELYPNCVAMTWADVDKMNELNRKCGWGFDKKDCNEFLFNHMKSYISVLKTEDDTAKNGARKMEMIEYRLEDANFHSFCHMLHTHDYGRAKDWIEEEYADD